MEAERENKLETFEDGMSAVRYLNAPRELVWKVWTEPEHIANWWGPDGFRNTIHKMEVKENGVWKFIMHGPDGTDYKNKIVYEEVKKPELLVYSHVSGPVFNVRIDFEDLGDITKLTMVSKFKSVDEFQYAIKQFGAVEGLKQTLCRLDDYLTNIHVNN
jgi:uncharacterized protein YndB with AHSA1/START domain